MPLPTAPLIEAALPDERLDQLVDRVVGQTSSAIELVLAANPNLADKDGVSPLQHARKRGQSEVAKLIAAAGGR